MEKQQLPPRRKKYGLRKEERLSGRTMVNALFREGAAITCYPLRCIYSFYGRERLEGMFRSFDASRTAPLQMMVSVPKKKRRHAVDRVLMRRRIREAGRLGRLPLEEAVAAKEGLFSMSVAFVYMAERNHSYAKIEARMGEILERLVTEAAAKQINPDEE